MKKLFLLLFICSALDGPAQTSVHGEITNIMTEQQEAWNNGDLEGFMSAYWKSDSLKFIGSKGITYGWQNTLDNYKKSYPDKATMGELKFEILSIEELSPAAAIVVGKWALKRKKGDVGGYYTLLWKKIGGKWVIVSDHTS